MSYQDDLKAMQSAGITAPSYLGYSGQSAGQPPQDYGGLNAALGGVRQRALGTGPSPWMTAMLGQQATEQGRARDQAAQEGMSGLAQARSSLAMRGGLSGGASERAALMGARDLYARKQDIASQGQTQRQNIGIEDERQRQAMLGQLPGMETSALGAHLNEAQLGQQNNQFNTSLGANQAQYQNQFNMDRYKQQMGQYGASSIADIIKQQGEAADNSNPFSARGMNGGTGGKLLDITNSWFDDLKKKLGATGGATVPA